VVSRGHWEGETLVVDVTNFSPKSQDRRLRVAREPAPGRALDAHRAKDLAYEALIEDPTVWTRPWTMKQGRNEAAGNETAERFLSSAK
jgi:hypothetical protein